MTPLTEAADAAEDNHQEGDCVFLASEDGELHLSGDLGEMRSGTEEVVNSMNCKYINMRMMYFRVLASLLSEGEQITTFSEYRLDLGMDGRAVDCLISTVSKQHGE